MGYERLLKLLKRAQAPITGRRVACFVLTENNNILEGFNKESKKDTIHAEEMALKKNVSNEKIKEINLMANGKASNIKNAVPCKNCFELISQYSNKDTKLIFYFNKKSVKFEVLFKDIKNYYNPKIRRKILNKVDKKLIQYFCQEIRKFNKGKKYKLSLYLTGTSSGINQPKIFLIKKITGSWYWDIDFLIISDNLPSNINSLVKRFYENSLKKIKVGRRVEIKEKSCVSYREEKNEGRSKDFLFRKIYWRRSDEVEITEENYEKNCQRPSLIDVSVGKKLNSVITDKYLKEQLYLKLI